LKAQVTPPGVTDKTVTWSIPPADQEIATVNGGLVTAHTTAGKTTVTVTTTDGSYTATRTVIVGVKAAGVIITDAEHTPNPVGSITLTAGESKTLTAVVKPDNATIKAVKWESVDPSVAMVDANGRVIGVSQGATIVKVTPVGGGVPAYCAVTVNPKSTVLSDDCDITEYRFTESGRSGIIILGSGDGGSAATAVKILIPYFFYTGIPGDAGIAITHTETGIATVDNTGAPITNPNDYWVDKGGGTFSRLYLVTGNTTTKYHSVTAMPSYDIHNTAEWNAALAYITKTPNGSSAANPALFRLNIVGDFDVPGISSSSITENYKEVRLTGTGTISLKPTTMSSLIRTAANQTFVLDGVTLSGRADNEAPLVWLAGGKMELLNGTISGNTAKTGGGGVYIDFGGTFTMEGGTVNGNTASTGGGVCVYGSSNSSNGGGTFTMSGGTISGNTASTTGGGVYVYYYGATHYGSFTKTGGTVYGDSPADTTTAQNSEPNANTATLGKNGHAVMLYKSGYYYRNETLGTGDNISTADTLPSPSGTTLGKWTMR
jgi:hypothetical protein